MSLQYLGITKAHPSEIQPEASSTCPVNGYKTRLNVGSIYDHWSKPIPMEVGSGMLYD